MSVLRTRRLRRTFTDWRFATAIAHLRQLAFEGVPTLRPPPSPTAADPRPALKALAQIRAPVRILSRQGAHADALFSKVVDQA